MTAYLSQLPTGTDIATVGTAQYTIGGVMMLFICYLAWSLHKVNEQQKEERADRNKESKETRDLLIDLVQKNTEITQANMSTIANLKDLLHAKKL